MVGASGRLALCLGLLLASTASGRQLKQEAEQPVVGVVAPVVGSVPLEGGPAPGPEGALLLTGPPILVAGTITVPATEPAGRETTTTGRGLKQEVESQENYAPASEEGGNGRKLLQAQIAPTAVAVLGAPTAESLLGSGGTGGRRLQQRESTIAQLVAPFTESLPGIGRKLKQGGESIAAQLLAPIAESLPGTGRKLKQGGESIAAQLLAPIAESLPGTGRRLQQGGSAENVVTAVGGVGSPLGENLAESASIGRRLQHTGLASAEPGAVAQRLAPAVESAVESALTGRRLAQTETGATPTEAITPGTAAAPTPVLALPGVVSAPATETSGRRLMQAETAAPTESTSFLAPVAELPEPVGRRLQQVSSGEGSTSDLAAVGSVGHGQLPAPAPAMAPSTEGGRRLQQAESTATELPAVLAPVAEMPGSVGRRLQQVSSGEGSTSDLAAVGSVGHGQLPAGAPSAEGNEEGTATSTP